MAVHRQKTVVVAGVTLSLVSPSLTEVFDSWPKLTSLDIDLVLDRRPPVPRVAGRRR